MGRHNGPEINAIPRTSVKKDNTDEYWRRRHQHGRALRMTTSLGINTNGLWKRKNGTCHAKGSGPPTKGIWLVEDSQDICKGDTLRNLRGYQSKVYMMVFSTGEEERLHGGFFYAFEEDLYALTHVYFVGRNDPSWWNTLHASRCNVL